MNYGRYFRINQSVSKVEDGVAIYDYIDLPAYFGSAEANRMSPQYPISMVITPDAVCFRLHYSAFKIECREKNEDPHYAYDKEDIYDKSLDFERESNIGMAHMEEVILELPYTDSASNKLPHIIKNIYNTRFPQIVDEKTSLGGRYLEQIIRKRFPETESRKQSEETEKKSIEDSLYQRIREVTDKTASYSTLWLMGLIKNNQISVYDEKDTKKITGFLRKLLLDFMFDMIHSDVFESNTYYASMREGLMNDFFFSSIIKKCEFYYYRSLIGERFSIIKDDSSFILSSQKESLLSKELYKRKKLRNKITQTIKCERSLTYRKEAICRLVRDGLLSLLKKKETKLRSELYSTNEAIQNHEATILNLDSTIGNIKDLYAEKLNAAEETWMDAIMSPTADKLFSFSPEWYEEIKYKEINEDSFRVSDSWFVNPEEEMRRIVFPLPKKNNQRETLYLNSYELSQFIGSKDDSSIINRNTKVSKWFYCRFDFKDTFQLHLFDNCHWLFFTTLAIFVIALALSHVIKSPWTFLNFVYQDLGKAIYLALLPMSTCLFLISEAIYIKYLLSNRYSINKLDEILVRQRRKRIYWRVNKLALLFLLATIFLLHYETSSLFQHIFVTSVFAIYLIYISVMFGKRCINNIHLFLPRLVAAITTAWIMLVIGNSIFEEHLSIPIWIVLLVIVFTFILYENDKTLPNISIGLKIWRALELMTISYSISLTVGIFAINIYNTIQAETIYTLHFFNHYEGFNFFICPDYLIPFSVLTMFIGVFVQMFFEEKKITEL